jgi:hypoxanthine phosphoribosyltransferase
MIEKIETNIAIVKDDNSVVVDQIVETSETSEIVKEIINAINNAPQDVAKFVATQYQRDRVCEYPAISDQLDALWKGGDDATEMLAKVQAVKAKYPKPE